MKSEKNTEWVAVKKQEGGKEPVWQKYEDFFQKQKNRGKFVEK